MGRSKKRYNAAVDQILAIKERFGGRMPTVRELANDPAVDLVQLANDLEVKPAAVTIEVLREVRRREGQSEKMTFVFPGRSPMSNPEKRYLGAAIKAQEANDCLWKSTKQKRHREPH
ncbi:hypothetical protein IJ103_01780 [Candidatus Saccharibacteria bacterium]|nr:hypothetical protein [Candidatus Saccharibacteria bacterium]